MKEVLNWHGLFKGAGMLTCAVLRYLTVPGYRRETQKNLLNVFWLFVA